jgi:hypothetical protein
MRRMWRLFGSRDQQQFQLVATFDSEQQLLSYVRWATLEKSGHRTGKFEQGSVLAPYRAWDYSYSEDQDSSEDQDRTDSVVHNPSPSML